MSESMKRYGIVPDLQAAEQGTEIEFRDVLRLHVLQGFRNVLPSRPHGTRRETRQLTNRVEAKPGHEHPQPGCERMLPRRVICMRRSKESASALDKKRRWPNAEVKVLVRGRPRVTRTAEDSCEHRESSMS